MSKRIARSRPKKAVRQTKNTPRHILVWVHESALEGLRKCGEATVIGREYKEPLSGAMGRSGFIRATLPRRPLPSQAPEPHMSNDLKLGACPFCGADDNIPGHLPQWKVWAIDCECGVTMQGDTKEEIIAWNRRASLPVPVEGEQNERGSLPSPAAQSPNKKHLKPCLNCLGSESGECPACAGRRAATEAFEKHRKELWR